ncbi:hypothetical protein M8267_14030 [Enterococcus faecalis]|uniref:hypothetical protein n=1 Tax=Enterococcus faecalis TaxID=1351 RepID=UPI0020234C90|nr:hypothetical protein [Enterococcus faecalis]MCL8369492.1 hypothetical protein [Enterococcus faecalis]
MKGEVMEVRDETKTLFLVPGAGKDVRLYFNQTKTKLEKVRLSLNKVAEILSNGFIDEQSFLQIESIGLITRSNFKTMIRIEGIQQGKIEQEVVNVTVDTKETQKLHDEKNKPLLGQPYFEFIIDAEEQISHEALYNLSKKNDQTLKEINKQKKKDSYYNKLARSTQINHKK